MLLWVSEWLSVCYGCGEEMERPACHLESASGIEGLDSEHMAELFSFHPSWPDLSLALGICVSHDKFVAFSSFFLKFHLFAPLAGEVALVSGRPERFCSRMGGRLLLWKSLFICVLDDEGR